MDLMRSSTSYNQLKTKYKSFLSPTVRVMADGVDIALKLGAKIAHVSVSLTSGFEAGSCTFDILDEYRPEKSAFDPDGAYAKLQIGAKIELAIGYIATETVFVGLVAEVEYVWGQEGRYFRVTCLDAKFLMMKTERLEVFTGRKVSEEISAMFSAQPFSAYIAGKAIDDTGNPEDELFLACENDYALAVKQAKRLGYEFFILAGTVYYRKPPTSSTAIMELNAGSGLLEARFSLRAGSLFKTAEVVGVNPQDGKALKATAATSGKFSKGSTAQKMLANTKKSVYIRSMKDASEATARAKEMITRAEGEFGLLSARCIGIPELVPGRSVKISGLMPEANATFYIQSVGHTMDEDGFVTTLEARVNSI